MSRMDLDRNLIVMSVGQSQGITIQWSSCDICHHYRIHGPCVVRCSSSIYQESSLTILGEYFSTKILIENRCLSRGGNSNKILVGTSIAKFLIFHLFSAKTCIFFLFSLPNIQACLSEVSGRKVFSHGNLRLLAFMAGMLSRRTDQQPQPDKYLSA